MKCPYYVISTTQVNQYTYEYDENNLNTFTQHKLLETNALMDCLKEECAVWINGRCMYRGD